MSQLKLLPPSSGDSDNKQTDSVLDTFDYFHEKSKEKEDDLHKSYNDRSYLSSEDLAPGESRTGEWDHLLTDTQQALRCVRARIKLKTKKQWIQCDSFSEQSRGIKEHDCLTRCSIPSCRLCCSADRSDRLMASQLQWCCQSSLLSDQKQPGLLHHIPEVKHVECRSRAACSPGFSVAVVSEVGGRR